MESLRLFEERGITEPTNYPMVFSRSGVDFLYRKGTKHRVQDGPNRKIWFDGDVGLYWPIEPNAKRLVLTEGETDCLRLAQELPPEEYTVCALSGADGLTNLAVEEIKSFNPSQIWVVLDNDEEYAVTAHVNEAWKKIANSLKQWRPKRIYLPNDVKDVCEFFKGYSVDAFQTLLSSSTTGKFHYEPLDFNKPPQPVDWLVNGLIARGDICILQGEPNVGKSFLTMGLAAALAEGHSQFLNHSINPLTSKVVYIDQENPEDVVRSRLRQLGLRSNYGNVRYLYRQGIRLDTNPGALIEDCLAWEPDLIILDSLTRLHTINENNAGEVAALFNNGINPLARETGAAVIFLHHTNKSESNSSYAKARGSTDITASPDTGFELRRASTSGHVNLIHFKSRRGKTGALIPLQIVELDEETVKLEVVKEDW